MLMLIQVQLRPLKYGPLHQDTQQLHPLLLMLCVLVVGVDVVVKDLLWHRNDSTVLPDV